MKKIASVIFILRIIITSGCIEMHEKVNLSIVQEPEIILNDTSVKVAIASVVSPKES